MNLSELYTQHQKALTRVARRIVKNAADAEDVTQDAFVSALQADFRGDCRPYSWLFRIVQNRARDWLRLRKSSAARESSYHTHWPRSMPVDPDTGPRNEELRAALDCAMDKLPQKYLIPFRLHMIRDWPFQEIGTVMGLPYSTVKTRIFRAREMLQVLLAEWDPYPKS